jgi:hypothetical protein
MQMNAETWRGGAERQALGTLGVLAFQRVVNRRGRRGAGRFIVKSGILLIAAPQNTPIVLPEEAR